jgi:hypothetical protein
MSFTSPSLYICIEQGKSLLDRIDADRASGKLHEPGEVWDRLGRLQDALGALIGATAETDERLSTIEAVLARAAAAAAE